jgi:hypothetical protein
VREFYGATDDSILLLEGERCMLRGCIGRTEKRRVGGGGEGKSSNVDIVGVDGR